ncbi:MAG: Excinuclease cho [Pseudomonadota bacterium]
MPIYIGKSVDLRARVRAHQLAPDEADMMAKVSHVEIHETAGEIGALLLESQLIKRMQPLHNIRLRRSRQLVSLQLLSETDWPVLEWVQPKDPDWVLWPDRFGVFASRHAGKLFLQTLAQKEGLCLSLLGLEPKRERGCFARQLHRCAGACVGEEPLAQHRERLRMALSDMQIHVWPFKGPIDLIEQRDDWIQRLRIDRWQHMSTWCSKGGEQAHQASEGFDWDVYRILLGPVLMGRVATKPVEASAVAPELAQAPKPKRSK